MFECSNSGIDSMAWGAHSPKIPRHDMKTRWKSGADIAKLDNLRRMQGIALALLLTMVALLAATSLNIVAHPLSAWLKAFAEAAVVGAVADWFAVVALFRHPLGLPISHTAIIPNNKDRMFRSEPGERFDAAA
jgi:hypothetical protein